MVLLILLLLFHMAYTQKSVLKSQQPFKNQIKGIWVNTITDTLGTSTDVSKDER